MPISNFQLNGIIRSNLRNLQPYRCARDDYDSGILLDANENAYGAAIEQDEQELNRYPDPCQKNLKNLIGEVRGVHAEQIFLGVGSDEAIDLLIRIVCVPGKDSIIITPPTYGMYKVSAHINDITICPVPLTTDFQLHILHAVTVTTKIIFLCSPGNPTANTLSQQSIEQVLSSYTTGLVVLDEAYVDFSPEGSLIALINKYPNLVVLQTMSKSFGLAGIRLGLAFGSKEIVEVLNKVKAPYNINTLTSEVALKAFSNLNPMRANINRLLQERDFMATELVYQNMAEKGVVVRYRGKEIHCRDCLRITIGTREENVALLKLLKQTISELVD